MFAALRSFFSPAAREAQVRQHLDKLREGMTVPVFWLLGKTQSGKSSIVRFLTGSPLAVVGQGFKPCTRHSARFRFPSDDAPLMTFLDTRGLEEPGYDASEDLAAFDQEAHVVVITVKALDHAQEKTLEALRAIRKARPQRPVLLALTCLHEAYPQQQHPAEYPENLTRSIDEQKTRFAGLFDAVVPIDLTPSEEGFSEPDHGGAALRKALLDMLPEAYRQALVTLDETTGDLRDLHERLALPHIVAHSAMAAAAGALPIPWVDLLLLPGIQTRMIHEIAEVYGQEMNRKHFLELASSLGLGLVLRQAAREATKFIPFVGSVAAGALAAASTFALGKVACHYYSEVRKGHVPRAEGLQRYYREQLSLAENVWSKKTSVAKGGRG